METMNPNTKAPAKASSNKLADELRTEPGIPVYELRFRGTPGPDLPLKTRTQPSQLRASERIEITYLLRLQLYRVVEATREKGAKDVVVYVPREWASWEPMP